MLGYFVMAIVTYTWPKSTGDKMIIAVLFATNYPGSEHNFTKK